MSATHNPESTILVSTLIQSPPLSMYIAIGCFDDRDLLKLSKICRSFSVVLESFLDLFHSDDNVSQFAPFFDISVRLYDLLQRVCSVDDCIELSVLN
jgi:hypothetical protein